MRHWGIIITACYALIVMVLLVPGAYLIAGHLSWDGVQSFYSEWMVWLVLAVLVGGQALLLFLSVDTSKKRLRPRAHVALSMATTSLLIALLGFAVVWALTAAYGGDDMDELAIVQWMNSQSKVLGWWGGLWGFWFIVFYLYFKDASSMLSRMLSLLLKGSVLELLVVVPCHILVRHRDECSAPFVTGFGIATGVAIMLLSFGPSVLFLYKKRLSEYSRHGK